MISIAENNFDIIKYLVKKGANLKIKNNLPFKTCLEYGQDKAVKLFLNNGCDINLLTLDVLK